MPRKNFKIAACMTVAIKAPAVKLSPMQQAMGEMPPLERMLVDLWINPPKIDRIRLSDAIPNEGKGNAGLNAPRMRLIGRIGPGIR